MTWHPQTGRFGLEYSGLWHLAGQPWAHRQAPPSSASSLGGRRPWRKHLPPASRPGMCPPPSAPCHPASGSGDSPPVPTMEVVDLGVPRGVRSAGVARGPAAHVPPLVPCVPRLRLRLQGDICASVDVCLSLASSLVSSCLQAVAALPIALKAPVPSSWRQLTILSFRGRLPRSPSCHAP